MKLCLGREGTLFFQWGDFQYFGCPGYTYLWFPWEGKDCNYELTFKTGENSYFDDEQLIDLKFTQLLIDTFDSLEINIGYSFRSGFYFYRSIT